MKRRLTIGILLGALCMQSGCAKIQEYFETPLEEGLAYLKEEKYSEAITSFEASIDKKKDVGEAYRGIGIAYWEQENYQQAEEAFTDALLNGVDKTGTLYNFLAICDWKEQDLDGALQDFMTGIRCEPEGSELRQEMEFNVICIYEEKQDWANAKARMEEYIAAYPEDEQAQKEAEFLRTR